MISEKIMYFYCIIQYSYEYEFNVEKSKKSDEFLKFWLSDKKVVNGQKF